MNDNDREKILDSLSRWICNAARGDPQWVRDFLGRWRERHGDESADDLRERCRREWKARADDVPGVRGEA